MKKVCLFTLLTLATLNAFASEKETSEDLKPQQSFKKYGSLEQYPEVTIQEILTGKIKEISQIGQESLKEFFNNQLHLSKTSVRGGTRYTTNLDDMHINYIELHEKINIGYYDGFIFNPSSLDAGGVKGSVIVPITCLKGDTEKTLRIFVELPPKLPLKETTSQTPTPQSSLSPRTSPQISLSVPKEPTAPSASKNKEIINTPPLKNEALLDTIPLPPSNTSPRKPSIKLSSSPQTSETLIKELKEVQKQRNK